MTSIRYNVYINSKNIDIRDRGFNFGDGVFETILVKNKNAKNLKDHFQRLKRGCETLKIKPPSFEFIKSHSMKAISKHSNCILKIYVTRGSNDQGYTFTKDIVHNIYFRVIPKIPSVIKITGLDLKISKYVLYSNINYAGVKHMNRIDQSIAAHDLLYNSKYDDMILVNDKKNIIETISSNIFFVKQSNSKLNFYTPKIEKCGVEGIMRNKVIEWLEKRDYKVIIKQIPTKNIHEYDYCFITNSIKGLRFVKKINSRKYKDPSRLLEVFESLVV
tara:strand:- start:409 stop:1230 length:822 start_codon:yes stop_codon:yes gene_type:complete